MKFKTLSIDALLKLRTELDQWLGTKRRDIEQQLSSLAAFGGSPAKRGRKPGRGPHPLKGQKRPPKFRDPATGATWAGVGATPRWLKEYAVHGRAAEEFAVAGAAGAKFSKAPKKRGRKPGRPKKVGRPRKVTTKKAP